MAEHVISRITLPNQDVCILKDSGAARNEHVHDILITTTAGVTTTNLSANTQYQITAGGSNLTFKTPSDANNKVTQTGTTTSAAYEILFSETATNDTKTEGAKKTSTLTYNPSTKALVTGGTINGYTLAAAAAKGVTDNSSNADVTSSDTNLITGRTLYYQLAKKGYTTNTGTVTNIATGSGLTGGPITTTGTIGIATSGITNDMIANNTIDKSKLLQNTISIGDISIPLGGSVSLADLGLDSAMHYRGAVSAIPPASGTYASGDVVILQNTIKEYIYDGTNWRELGTEGSYKIKQTAYSDSTGTSEDTTATRFIYSISQDADGVVSAKTRPLPAYISKAGDTINGDLYFESGKYIIFKHNGSTTLSVNPFQVSIGLNGFTGSGSNYTPRLKITPTSLISGVATPTENEQAANKLYVDNKFNSGITAITWDSENKTITKTANNSASNIITFIAGNNISLSAGTNGLTINNTYSYSLPLAANGTRGGVQVGYTTSGKNYAVQLDSNEKMYVNVPWTNINSDYLTGITSTTSSTSGNVVTGISASGNTITYTLGSVSTSGHTHTLSLAADTGTSSTTLAHGGKYKLTAGGNSVTFTLPSDNNTTYTFDTGDANGQIKITPSNGTAQNVSVAGLGTAAYTSVGTFSTAGHTHTTSLTAGGSSPTSLGASTTYTLTAGETSIVFKTPPNTWNAMGGATSAANGTVGYINAVPPKDGYNTKYWRADGTWAAPPDNNSYHTSGSWDGFTYTATSVGNAGTLAFTIPTGTSSTQVAIGNHTHNYVSSITITQGAGITVSDSGTAITTSGTRTISINGINTTSGSTSLWLNQKGGWTTPTAAQIGAATTDHTHTTTLATDSGTSNVSLSYSGKYKLTTGGTSTIFTMPEEYSLPLAANGTRGGVQIGYTTNNASQNYAVQLSSEKMYVNVPWTDTKVEIIHL